MINSMVYINLSIALKMLKCMLVNHFKKASAHNIFFPLTIGRIL